MNISQDVEDKIKNLSDLHGWNWPDTMHERVGYDLEEVPELSRNNFILLVEEHKTVVDILQLLLKDNK